MNKNEFEILNLIRKEGKLSYRELAQKTNVSLGTVSNIVKSFINNNYISNDGITSIGLNALLPYKVNNAIILAAGPSSRFVPLSLEQPKGLFKVKDEVLIERQIKQLLEAGIKDIILVLGYKKEAFFYLKGKFNVKILINPNFNKKNNIESINIAKNYLSSSYICSCDDYFVNNPFDLYEYSSYYASVAVESSTNEMYAITNSRDEIISMQKGLDKGNILLGHSFWNNEFSNSFKLICKKYNSSGEYDGNFWEKIVADHLKDMPSFYIKKYPQDTIFEFDFVEELRAFDNKYINNTESKIMANICQVLKCQESEIIDFHPIHEGLTNTSFIFTVKSNKYVYRMPGEGTDKIINRKHKKIVLETAKKYNFDSTYLYMDENEGWKISTFVDNFKEPDYNSFNDSLKVIEVLKQLHSIQTNDINWIFNPIEEAQKMEQLIKAKSKIQMQDFEMLKNNILAIYNKTLNDGVKKCWCHSDTYKPNWMITPNKTILIDWEYSGISDSGIDVGYYIVDAMYSFEDAEKLINAYCGDSYNETLKFHYFGYTAIIAYYWFVWALYRESCGAVMGESLYNWYIMAKKYSEYIINNMMDKNSEKKLNRYEFELLRYLIDKKNIELNVRYLSNELLLSENALVKAISSCKNNNYIAESNSKISITATGLKSMDAYKVSRAVIMAAGFGSRMMPATKDRPKPLVKVNGKRIIDTLIDSLLANDINEIYIIRGYKKEVFSELLEKYPFIHLIDNDEYNVTNNISSIIKAINYIDNCYICEADFLVSNTNIISKYHYQSDYLGTRVIETDDWCFRNQDGYAIDYKKGNTNCYQAYGISYWNKEDSQKLRNYLPKIYETIEGKQQFWESCVFDYYKGEFKIEIKNCSKFDIVEIDGFDELVELDSSYKK